jgi:hypothetical protein
MDRIKTVIRNNVFVFFKLTHFLKYCRLVKFGSRILDNCSEPLCMLGSVSEMDCELNHVKYVDDAVLIDIAENLIFRLARACAKCS